MIQDSRAAGRVGQLQRWSVVFGVICALLVAAPSQAKRVWVKDEVHLQLRTGAGNQFRITGRIKTGDTVEILTRGEGWTQIQTAEGVKGWIPAGFLQPEPPARIALEKIEGSANELRDEVARLSGETAQLRTTNEELASRDGGQRSEIDRLTRENYELRAGARWPEWITGAGIVLVGMALGAILSRSSGRRRQQRIRL